ncbi:MAG: tetratricopeptide repeat protein [Myxococcota bacterium]
MASPKRKPEPKASNKEASEPTASTNTKGEAATDEAGYLEGMRITSPDRRDSLGKAFIHVIVATVLLGGGLYMYWEKVQRDEEVHDLAADARTTYLRDNYRQLIEAEELLDEALALNGRHRYSIATKGLINAYLWHDHGVEERRQVAEEYTSLAEERSVHLQERYGARGLLMLGSGEPDEAEHMLVEDVINQGGAGPAISGSLALAERLLGKRTDARAALQRAAEAERRTPRFNYWIAQMYFEGEDYGNAAQFIERALDVNPDHLHSLVLRARVQIVTAEESEEREKAGQELAQILERSDRELSPKVRAVALIGTAEHQIAEKRFEEAIASAEQALEVIPELPDAHVVKGLAMINLEQDGALAEIIQGLDMFHYMPRAYHDAARALLEAEMFDEAREIMELWGERVTRNASYHVAFGNLLLEGEEIEEAKTHFERAIDLNPRAAEAHYRLGTLALVEEGLEREEQIDKARDLFNEAVKARERYPEVYEEMGWLYLEKRAYGEGLRQFIQAINYYKAQNAEFEKLEKLVEAVGEKLAELRQHRMSRMWIQESRELIH